MPRCCSLDFLLSYSTPKTVIIRDRWLGFLRILFAVPIIVYLVYAVIIDGKHYMRRTIPQGAVYSSLQRPASLTVNTNSLSYCETGASPPDVPKFGKAPCIHVDGSDASMTSDYDGNLVATTKVASYSQNDECPAATCTDPWGAPSDESGQKFIAAIEDFQIKVLHYAQGSELLYSSGDRTKYTLLSTTGDGTLKNAQETILEYFPGTGVADFIRVGTLLEAVGVTSLDDPCDSNTCEAGSGATIRDDGLPIIVFVRYWNTDALDKKPKYEYLPYRLPKEGFRITEVLPYRMGVTFTRTVQQRSAIRITFVQIGELGRFDFPALFVHVASAVALILLSIFVIDMLMLWVVPRSRLYRRVVYETPVDFDQVQAKSKTLASNLKGSLLSDNDRDRVAFQIVAEERQRYTTPLERDILVDPELNARKAEELCTRLLVGGLDVQNRELTNEELEAMFTIMDEDDNKQLEFDEVKKAFDKMGMPQTDDQIRTIMGKFCASSGDAERSAINKDEFILLCKAFPINFTTRARILIFQRDEDEDDFDDYDEEERDGAHREHETDMRTVFQQLDTDNDGQLRYDQVHRFLTERGLKLSPVEFKLIMEKVDVNNDQAVVVEEFDALYKLLTMGIKRRKMLEAQDAALYGSGATRFAPGSVAPAVHVVPAGGNAVGAAAGGVGGSTLADGPEMRHRMNHIDWKGVKTQFRALTNYINGLRDELRELTVIVRMLQRRVIPQTLENVTDHEPLHLEGDWNGEVAEECRLT